MAENIENAVYYSDGEIHFVVTNIKTKHEPTERSNDEILRIFNKRRPYCPNDFKKQTFIPNLRHIDEKQR